MVHWTSIGKPCLNPLQWRSVKLFGFLRIIFERQGPEKGTFLFFLSLFNEAASWGLVKHLFLKLNTLMYLSSCSVVHRGLPLPGPPTVLVRATLRCSVKGVVHTIVWDLQFLGNFSHGITLISQNKNRLTSFRRKCFVSGHFEPVIEPTNADAPDTQLV